MERFSFKVLQSSRLRQLFSFKGRIGRREFNGTFFTVILVYLMLTRIAMSVIDKFEIGIWFVLYVVGIFAITGTILVGAVAKRLHDIDIKEHGPTGLVIITGVAVLLGAALITRWHTGALQIFETFDFTILWPVGSFLYLVSAKGDSLPNRYGPPSKSISEVPRKTW